MTIETAPPMAHAVGGSLGSALALLLLYPLERARVEMQTIAASADTNDGAASANLSEDIHKDKVKPLLQREQQERPSRGGGLVAQVPSVHSTKSSTKDNNVQASVSEESWESCRHQQDSVGDITSSDDEEVANTPPTVSTSGSSLRNPPVQAEAQKQRKQKLGLLNCIYQLHQRNQLYRGVAPVATTMAASNFVFFYMHSFLKQWLQKLPHHKDHHPTSTLHLSLLASTLAGICNVLLTNPMWVANLRIVTNDNQENGNLWQEMKSIVATEGWTHLWNGTPASLLLVSNPVIQFVAYEHLKNKLLQTLRQHPHSSSSAAAAALKPLEAFLLGAVAKAISTVLTYPLQLAQTVLRVQKQELQAQQQQQTIHNQTTAVPASSPSPQPPSPHPQHHQQYRGTLDCLIKIYQHKGMEGWFAGMRTKLLQTVLTAAFTFLTYEQIIRAIMAVHRALQEGRRVRHGRASAPVP